jgi:hypothetical protein
MEFNSSTHHGNEQTEQDNRRSFIMPVDLTVILEDRPGTLAEMGEALGNAGINIDGMCGFTIEGKGVIHLLVEDAAEARPVLETTGINVKSMKDVLLVEAEDRPGMLGEVARKLANAGVNIELLYKATQTMLVIAVDDLEKAKEAI